MITSRLVLTVGHRLPSLDARLTLNGVAYDLTGRTPTVVISALDGGTVLGSPSPFLADLAVVSAVAGTVRYDWTQPQVDAARAGEYEMRIKVRDTATGLLTAEFPTRATSTVVIRPTTVGYNYLIDGAGKPVLSADGQSIRV
jgi:hypothetical protein